MRINNQIFSKYHFSCFVFIHPKSQSFRRCLASQTHGVDSASPSNPSGWKMHLQVDRNEKSAVLQKVVSQKKNYGKNSFYKHYLVMCFFV